MPLDLDGRYDSYDPVGGAIRKWDGVLLSVGVHVAVFVLMLLAPTLPMFQPGPEALEAESRPPQEDRSQFVFVQPRQDMEAPRPPQMSEASDKNRVASSPDAPTISANPLPSARGDSPERTEAVPEERAAGRGPAEPSAEPPTPDVTQRLPQLPSQRPEMAPTPLPPRQQGGSLGEALRNLQKYVDKESFSNDKGQTQNLGPLQFDTKGVEFGPWIRRFVSQVRRNWFVPQAAMTLRGRVVLTFNVHRSGALTDVQVVQPSPVASFNTAAMNALLASNPTEPLPPEYPSDKAFFTVTFYYNDTPGGE
ncbi:MAG TPA: TonB family protein [Vicinamibacterales bacterium]|nr:TonB family protein [Vicinamibacterales bacterium]